MFAMLTQDLIVLFSPGAGGDRQPLRRGYPISAISPASIRRILSELVGLSVVF
jgi:hypothetical protein